MSEGFYSVVFQGIAGNGGGMIVLDTQMVVGADPWGAMYDGTYVINTTTNTIDIDVTVTMPNNIISVTGHPPGSKFKLKGSIPRGTLVNHPFTFTAPDGKSATVVLNKIRDFPN